MQRLACQECHRPYESKDIDRPLGIATCASCGAVWRLGERERRAPAPRPDRWTETEEGGELVLRRRWRGAMTLFLILWCIIWDGALASFWVGFLNGTTANAKGGGSHILFILPHTIVGIGMTYYVLASLLNTTELHIGRMRLAVSYRPLPWPGASEIPSGEVRQLYVRQTSMRTNRQRTYNLNWIDRERVSHVLMRWMRDLGEARWLEQRIEARLEIADEPVEGEA